jgi:hypothetical protein
MSALGHKQTPVITYATSASPLKADMREPAWICPLRAKRVPMHCSKTHSYYADKVLVRDPLLDPSGGRQRRDLLYFVRDAWR